MVKTMHTRIHNNNASSNTRIRVICTKPETLNTWYKFELSLHHLGGWGVTPATVVAEVEEPSMEVIWMTALSSDPTGRYRRPLGGAGTGSPSSAVSITPFSIPLGAS
jgi:hypothetical protein